MWNLLREIAGQAAAMEEEIYLVGGALRDLLLGQNPEDFDLSLAGGSRCLAEKIAQQYRATLIPLDQGRETLRVVLSPEIHLDFCLFKGQNILEDLQHRDFTINALALNLSALPLDNTGAWPPANWQSLILDPTGGREDLNRGLLRVTHAEAMTDDPLRVLRGIRLAALFNLAISPETIRLMKRGTPLPGSVAGERIWQELSRILALPRVYPLVEFMDRELELWHHLIPCRVPMEETRQNRYHTENVWRHCLRTLECLEQVLQELPLWLEEGQEIVHFLQKPLAGERNRLQVLKLAALIHDIGKPDTACLHKDGGISFHGHPEAGLPYAADLAGRLKWSNAEKQYLLSLILYHMRPLQLYAQQNVSNLALYRLGQTLGENGPDVFILSLADVTATHTAGERLGELATYRNFILGLIGRYNREKNLYNGKLLSGKDLLGLGIPEGPLVGKLLAQLAEEQVKGTVKDVSSAKQWVLDTFRTGAGEKQDN
ncbi:CCA tRNA nucleotidyltransferase [Desulforamulus ruminis]|uniref:CCA tRNA nucleotidyltransferase n=1 Tax=Desulforamulus ruminis TaxID=1564 RepID=UPI0023522CE0|nr:HD domain-containing protein [Desulforamulus ruminis]